MSDRTVQLPGTLGGDDRLEESAETDEATLARLIEASSGLDPRANEIEFQLRTDLACARCDQVRATAVLYDDTCDETGRGAERLCVDCCDAWA